jgi:hypothetical protein
VRLLGRTAVECTRDDIAEAIGRDIAAVANAGDAADTLVIDPFAGSANTLYWILRHLPKASARGFELDSGVFELTRRNLDVLDLPIDVRNTDFRSALAALSIGPQQRLIVFIAPPWGHAFSDRGLDLRRTDPPVAEIVDTFKATFSKRPLLCAVQTHETVDRESLVDLGHRFDWSEPRLYTFDAPGRNHGLFLGTVAWHPTSTSPEGA